MGLPVHLLQPAAAPAAPLAPRFRRGAGRRVGARATSAAAATARGARRCHRRPASTCWPAPTPCAFIADLLRATASRPARLNCFGLHEWAMVYRAPTVRHAPGAAAARRRRHRRRGRVDAVALQPLRRLPVLHRAGRARATPSSSPGTRQVATEQPGCLHAAMDLYKWALQAGPAGGLRAGDGLPGAGRRRPRARHAGQPL